jgi:hypothetical protein
VPVMMYVPFLKWAGTVMGRHKKTAHYYLIYSLRAHLFLTPATDYSAMPRLLLLYCTIDLEDPHFFISNIIIIIYLFKNLLLLFLRA